MSDFNFPIDPDDYSQIDPFNNQGQKPAKKPQLTVMIDAFTRQIIGYDLNFSDEDLSSAQTDDPGKD